MPCYSPWIQLGSGGISRPLACGQCIGCRLKRSLEWATRCVHEAQMHEHSCFVTLTYNDENLPVPPTLRHRDFQLFLKRLRKALGSSGEGLFLHSDKPAVDKHSPKVDGSQNHKQQLDRKSHVQTISYYMSGEYGERNRRPHYHACLFGVDFQDKTYDRTTKAKEKIYTSKTLDQIWGKGYASIGAVTFASAAYIARYIVAKKTGAQAETHYQIVDQETGEILPTRLKPEYNQMSLKPAIGKRWLDKYQDDVYPHGYVVINEHKKQTPRYYDKLFEMRDRKAFLQLKKERTEQAKKQEKETTNPRLQARETVQLAQLNQLKRKL